MTTLGRIREQAEKALAQEPVTGLEDVPLGLMGLTHEQVRLGNIIAICRAAQKDAR